MSALRERLVRAGRAERAPDGLRQRVLRSAAAATGTGLLAGFGKLGTALAFVALVATGTATYSATLSSRDVSALRIAEPLHPAEARRTAAPATIAEPSAVVRSVLSVAAARAASPLTVAAPSASPAPPRSSLAAEVDALDAARAALSRDDVPRANAALAAFRRAFPRPMLGEEASALEIEALARGGSPLQARTRFQAFRSAHPTSPALGRLARILGEP